MKTAKTYLIKSIPPALVKTVRIMEACRGEWLTYQQIANAHQPPIASFSVKRHIDTLVENGIVERHPDTYHRLQRLKTVFDSNGADYLRRVANSETAYAHSGEKKKS
jgi:DNA-binding IclR family transcriptional regulator